MMELGATVCTPKSPNCDRCPVSLSCLAFSHGVQLLYPIKIKNKKARTRHLHYLVSQQKGKFLLERRTNDDIWAGLYQFPVVELPNLVGDGESNYSPHGQSWKKVWNVEHKLSHQHLKISFWENNNLNLVSDEIDNGVWKNLDEIDSMAFAKPLSNFIGEYLIPLYS